MAVLENAVTFSAIFSISFLPLMFFRWIAFKGVVHHGQRVVLIVSSAAILLVNAMVLVWLFRDWQSLSSSECMRRLKMDLIGYSIVSAVPFIVVLRKYWRENLFAMGTVGIFALMCLSTAILAVHYLPVHGILRMELLCVIMLALGLAIYPFVRSTLLSTVTPFIDHTDTYYWRNIWIIPNAMLIACVLAVPTGDFFSSPWQWVSRLLVGLSTVLMCRSITYDTVLYSERVHLESQIDAQRDYYRDLAARLHQDRRARHDFRHQLAAVEAMAKRGDLEDIQSFCREHLGDISRHVTVFTGNSALDAVLYRYWLLCEEHGFLPLYRGHFAKSSPMELDLCVALGNALDNALAATVLLPPERRMLEAEILPEGSLLTITVKNTFDGVILDHDGVLLSRKRQNEAGYGLASIRTVCETYGGAVKMHYDTDTFTVMMLFNIPPAS